MTAAVKRTFWKKGRIDDKSKSYKVYELCNG